MKKIIKNKKVLIYVITALVLISLILGGIFLFSNDDEEKTQRKETTNNYVAYIRINPLIKIEYSQTCKNEKCNDPIVTKYELVNDDAKDIYKNIDLIGTNNNLYDVITLISKTADENNVEFENVEIYSNWDNLNNYIDNSNKDTYKWSYIVNVRDKENLEDISSSLEQNKVLYNVEFETNGGTEINTQTVEKGSLANQPTTPTKKGYKFIEWQLNGKKFDFKQEINSDIKLVAKWEKVETSNNSSNKNENNTKPNNSNNNTNTDSNNSNNNKEETTNKQEKEMKTINFVSTFLLVELRNLSTSANYSASFLTQGEIKISITGEKDLINKYSINELGTYKLYVDLSSLKDGTHNVKLQIENTNKDFTYQISPSNASVKITNSGNSSTIGKINLNDNVLYGEAEDVYNCDNCVSDSILSLLKSAKGYYDNGSSNSYVHYKTIVLSDKYNTSTYKGQNYDFNTMLIEAGASKLGGSDVPPQTLLTEEVCNKYKLSCDRW